MLLLHGALIAAPAVFLAVGTGPTGKATGFCLFKAVLGVECPGCGMTHSAMALYNGQLDAAFKFHPAGPFLVAVLALMTVYFGAALAMGYKTISWTREVNLYNFFEVLAIGTLIVGWLVKCFLKFNIG